MRTTKKLGGLAAVTTMMLGAGVAFASWTSTGDGAGSAESTTDQQSAIAAGDWAADLYPGATKSVTVTVDNPNDYPVIVTQISAGSSDALAAPVCAAATVTSDRLGPATVDDTSAALTQADGTSTTIAAEGSGTFTLDTHMSASATDGCKSREFNLPLTAALRSDA